MISVKILFESWRFVRRTRKTVEDDHSDAIVEALRLPDEERLVQLVLLEVFLNAKARGSPDARVAQAAVSDLILSEIMSLRRQTRMGSSDRRDYDEMRRIRQESRQGIPSTPVFEAEVETLKRELVARSRGRSPGT